MARPLSQRTRTIIEALREGPATARDIARVIGEPIPAVMVTLRNISRAGSLEVVGEAPREGRQPVRVYRYREPRIIWVPEAPAWFR